MQVFFIKVSPRGAILGSLQWTHTYVKENPRKGTRKSEGERRKVRHGLSQEGTGRRVRKRDRKLKGESH